MRFLATLLLPTWMLAAGVAAQAPAPPAPRDGFARTSPFRGVRFEGDHVQVLFDGAWHRLVSVEGRSVADLLAHCRAAWPDKVEKRFAEDLPEVLAGVGVTPGPTVALVLVDASGQEKRIPAAPMTAENRKAVYALRHGPSAAPPSVRVRLGAE